MDHPGWLSLLPPLLSIALAVGTRQVLPALFAGIVVGWWLLGDGHPLAAIGAAIDGVIDVLADPGDTRVLAFALAIGALIAVLESGGAVRAFVAWLEHRRWVNSGRRAQWLAWIVGVVVFIESNLTLLVAGAVSRPVFDRLRVSREKLAYIIDSTSAPICMLIPLNAWGAFILSLLGTTAVADPLDVLVAAVPLTFYALLAVLVAALSIAFDWHPGPMRAAEARTRSGQLLWPGAVPLVSDELLSPPVSNSATNGPLGMLVPIMVIVIAVPAGLVVTGNGNPMQGSGSKAVLWAVLLGLLTAWLMTWRRTGAGFSALLAMSLRGAGGLLPVALILVFAIALGDVARLLGTGPFMAQVVGGAVPAMLLPTLIFLVSAGAAFAIGSSWGTFAIMIPVAMPIALAVDLPAPLLLGAVLSGAVFGDHASPISDTTVVASMAAATDHVDHVRTQLPYALTAAGLSALGYLIAGLWVTGGQT
ncbi:MAG: Na+/H+ antiporter NhaC family protein [Gammaproteobacteria bacterium]